MYVCVRTTTKCGSVVFTQFLNCSRSQNSECTLRIIVRRLENGFYSDSSHSVDKKPFGVKKVSVVKTMFLFPETPTMVFRRGKRRDNGAIFRPSSAWCTRAWFMIKKLFHVPITHFKTMFIVYISNKCYFKKLQNLRRYTNRIVSSFSHSFW